MLVVRFQYPYHIDHVRESIDESNRAMKQTCFDANSLKITDEMLIVSILFFGKPTNENW